MKRYVLALTGAASLGLLAACGGVAPSEPARAFSVAEIEVRDVFPTAARTSGFNEMFVQTRITNSTTDKTMPLNAGNWGLRLANDDFYFSRTTVSANESSCTASVVAPGQSASCNLFFGFAEIHATDVILPARVSYSPAGWSSGANLGFEWADTW